jgi:hypothetical protein
MSVAVMNSAMSFDALVFQWETAQKACARLELAFDEAVNLYLVGRGPPPSAELVSELAQARRSAWECLGSIVLTLQQSRETVHLL